MFYYSNYIEQMGEKSKKEGLRPKILEVAAAARWTWLDGVYESDLMVPHRGRGDAHTVSTARNWRHARSRHA